MVTAPLQFGPNKKLSKIHHFPQFDPPPPSALSREVPASLDRIVRRAMQKDAAKRYHSGDEFAEDLIEALRAGLGEPSRQTLGDAGNFALLRSMRFFSALGEQSPGRVVTLGHWDRVQPRR